MTYSNKTLIRIAREVVNKHPEIATGIIERMPIGSAKGKGDLQKIPVLYERFCLLQGQSYTGKLGNWKLTEERKVFIGAMATIYQGQYCFLATLADTLRMGRQNITAISQEILFRYKRDVDFKKKVDELLNTICNDQ